MSSEAEQAAGPRRNYHAYLMRLWRESEQAPWRASLTPVGGGEGRHFADPQAAWAYLQAQLEAPAAAPAPEHD
jgi:hypothetical protein